MKIRIFHLFIIYILCACIPLFNIAKVPGELTGIWETTHPDYEQAEIEITSTDIRVIYEDEALLVVNKPAPLPMHPGGRFHRNTLQHVLNLACEPHPPRAVHRLDANTTGVVRTEFRVLDRRPDGTTLLEARPLTGRTNQIRVHLRHLGHPVIGDPAYHSGPGPCEIQTLDLGAPPLRLHAWKLSLKHPRSGEPLCFEAGRPDWACVQGSSSVSSVPPLQQPSLQNQ